MIEREHSHLDADLATPANLPYIHNHKSTCKPINPSPKLSFSTYQKDRITTTSQQHQLQNLRHNPHTTPIHIASQQHPTPNPPPTIGTYPDRITRARLATGLALTHEPSHNQPLTEVFSPQAIDLQGRTPGPTPLGKDGGQSPSRLALPSLVELERQHNESSQASRKEHYLRAWNSPNRQCSSGGFSEGI